MTVAHEAEFPAAAMAAILFAVSTVSAGYGIVLPILPLILQAIDGPTATAAISRHTGLLTGVHALALFLFAPLWGHLSDQYGRRRILCIGLFGFGVSLLLPSVKLSIGTLYTERFLTGLFAAGITPVASALIADQGGRDEWRARRIAWLSMAAISGFLLGPMLSGLLATLSDTLVLEESARSYELPFIAIATIAIVASVTVRSLVPENIAGALAGVPDTGAQSARSDIRTSLMLRSLSFLVAAGVGVFEVGLAVRGNQELGMAPSRVALMFSACSLVMLITQGIVFSPKFKPASTRWLIAPALGVMAVSLLLVPFLREFSVLLATVATVAASAGTLAPVLTYWISLGNRKTKGAELGKQAAVVSLGQAIGSVAGGAMYTLATLPAAPFVVTAALLAAATLVGLILPGLLVPHQKHSAVHSVEGTCLPTVSQTLESQPTGELR